MLDFYDAQQELLTQIPSLTDSEWRPLQSAVGKVLAQDVLAQYDAPQFDNSAMDGYAVADPEGAGTSFSLVGRIAAGDTADIVLQPGQCVRIFTGAPVPQGGTAVVPQEKVAEVTEAGIRLAEPLRPAANIRFRGEEYAAGAVLLRAGLLLDAAAIALAASQGHAELPVLRTLKVAVFSSGDELLEPGQPLTDGKIFDANRHQLLAWMQGLPVEVVINARLPDNAEITRQRLEEAAQQCDVILTSGGVSVGEEDHMRTALSAIGDMYMWKLAIKPGKPFGWGQAGRAHVFMLPGNPVATYVTFFMLALPAMRKLMGLRQVHPVAIPVRAAFTRSKPDTRREFLRAHITLGEDGFWQAQVSQGQGSHMLATCVQANVLVEVPAHVMVTPGDMLKAYLLPHKGWM